MFIIGNSFFFLLYFVVLFFFFPFILYHNSLHHRRRRCRCRLCRRRLCRRRRCCHLIWFYIGRTLVDSLVFYLCQTYVTISLLSTAHKLFIYFQDNKTVAHFSFAFAKIILYGYKKFNKKKYKNVYI